MITLDIYAFAEGQRRREDGVEEATSVLFSIDTPTKSPVLEPEYALEHTPGGLTGALWGAIARAVRASDPCPRYGIFCSAGGPVGRILTCRCGAALPFPELRRMEIERAVQ